MPWGNNNNKDRSSSAPSSQLIPGRVLSIDQTSTLSNGDIMVEPMKVTNNLPGSLGIKASPLFPNIKNYPLKNETVYLLSFPGGNFSNNPGDIKYYYISPVRIWSNAVNTNPTPNTAENIQGSNQNKSLQEVELGSSNISTKQQTTKFKPGTYFTEKSNIFPLYPFEGDYIIEGRFGNSIRFGSTDIQSTDTTQTPLNSWSTFGLNGDPITILRNGQNPELGSPAQSTTIEEINKDLSSIYLTSTQQLPIEVASQNDYLSYGEEKPKSPNTYAGAQVVLNSGRLLFNTTQDHIMLSSQKSINLNAIESINFDTTGNTVIQSNQVYLGGIEESQPIILGNEMVDLVNDILGDLNFLCGKFANQLDPSSGAPLEPLASAGRIVKKKIGGYKTRLENTLSSTTRTV